MQQYRALLKAGKSKPQPRKQILQDLEKFIHAWKAQHPDSSVILMMDANGDITDTQFYHFITATALKDVVAHHSPDLTTQSTYNRGKKRIDYILVSEDLLHSGVGAGHTPFAEPFISDHRAVYWDIPYTALLGEGTNKMTTPSQRGLQLSRPNTVKLYIPALCKMYKHHKILSRATSLEKQLMATTDPSLQATLIREFSDLDLERVRYMKRAEKLCSSYKQKQYAWSPTLAKAGQTVSYWKSRLATFPSGNLQPPPHLGIKDTGSGDRQHIKLQLKLAWQALHQTQKHSDALRSTHLEDLATYKAEQTGTATSLELKKLIHIEAVRKTAQKHG